MRHYIVEGPDFEPEMPLYRQRQAGKPGGYILGGGQNYGGFPFVFPKYGPRPWTKVRQPSTGGSFLSAGSQLADGKYGHMETKEDLSKPRGHFTITNFYGPGNFQYPIASPWGAASEFLQGADDLTNNIAAHASLASDPAFNLYPTTTFDGHHFCLFLIVRNRVIDNWSRNIISFTRDGNTENILRIGINTNTDQLSVGYGDSPVTEYLISFANIADATTDWLRIGAYIEYDGTGTDAGRASWWMNGHKLVHLFTTNSVDLNRVHEIHFGKEKTAKGGLAWDGIIAQAVCLYVDDHEHADEAMVNWFEDPWWFIRKDIYMKGTEPTPPPPDQYACVHFEPDSNPEVNMESVGDDPIFLTTASNPSIGLEPEGLDSVDLDPDSNKSVDLDPEAC